MRLSRILYALAVLLFTASSTPAQVNYYLYDDLGRLSLVSFPDGSVVLYSYDANGNRELALQYGASTPVIESFSPSSGQAGISVTVDGAGFSATPALNAVTIGGVGATVTSASETELVVTVPLGAVTGPIAVSIGGPATSSLENFTVLTPSITGFSPAIANPLNNITLAGSSLYLQPGMTSVSVGSTGVNELSFDNEAIVFDAPSNSGPITVTTPYGSDVSAGTLIVVPAAISPANVLDVAEVALDEEATLTIPQQSAYGVLVFAATQNDWIRVRLTSLQTTPAGQVVNWVAYSPSGASIASGTRTSSTASPIYLPKIATTGVHVISFRSTTSSQIALSAIVEHYPEVPLSGTPVSTQTTVPNDAPEFTFVASAGDDLSLALTDLDLSTGSNLTYRVYRPSGSVLEDDNCGESSNPGCSMELRNLTQSGTYRIRVSPPSGATMSFDLTLTENIVGGELTIDMPANLTIPIVGQRAEYTFTATAGETFALNLSSIVTSPSGKVINKTVYDPAGAVYQQGTPLTFNMHDLAAGTYTIVLSPQSAATATLSVLVAAGVDEEIEADGSTQAYSTTVPDQDAYFTFDATSGDDLNLAITGFSVNPGSSATAYVDRPSGSDWINQNLSESSNPGFSIELRNASQTGTYQVRVSPYASGGIMSFSTTLSENLDAGTLVLNTPANVTIAVLGQRAELQFTVTSVQSRTLTLNSISTTPSGRSVKMQVRNASDTQIATATTSTSTTINLPNLAVGTYKVVLSPTNGATGSMVVTLN